MAVDQVAEEQVAQPQPRPRQLAPSLVVCRPAMDWELISYPRPMPFLVAEALLATVDTGQEAILPQILTLTLPVSEESA